MMRGALWWTALTLSTLLYVSVQAQSIQPMYRPYTYITDGRPILIPKREWYRHPEKRPHRVFLCLDGGGMRGIIPTTVLIEVELQIKRYILRNLDDFEVLNPPPGKTMADFSLNTEVDFHIFIADFFDGVSGISAGSWITTYIVTKGGYGASGAILRQPNIVNQYGTNIPGSLQGLRIFFIEYGSRIYPPPMNPFVFTPRFWATPRVAIISATAPMYRPDGLEWVLERFNGNVPLSQVATSTLIIAFDLYRLSAIEFIADYLETKTGRPKLITGVAIPHQSTSESHGGGDDDDGSRKKHASMEKLEDLDYVLRDISRASSAFPMIHGSKLVKPLNDITDYFDMVDGALVGNNPTLPTLAWALTHDRIDTINQTAYLSLGTGFARGAYTNIGDGGIAQWFGPIIELVSGGTPEYIQALLDYAFFVNAPSRNLKVRANQLLRIQLIKESGTSDGTLLANINQNREGILRMEEMAKLLGAAYRQNIQNFTRDFLLFHS